MAFWKKPEDERDPLGDKLVKPKSTGSSSRDYWMSGDKADNAGRSSAIMPPGGAAAQSKVEDSHTFEPPLTPPPLPDPEPAASAPSETVSVAPPEPIEPPEIEPPQPPEPPPVPERTAAETSVAPPPPVEPAPPVSDGALALKAETETAPPTIDDSSDDDDPSDLDASGGETDNIIDFRARMGEAQGAQDVGFEDAAVAAHEPVETVIATTPPEPTPPAEIAEEAVADAAPVAEERPQVAPRVVIGDDDSDISDQFDTLETDYDYRSETTDDAWDNRGDDYVYADDVDNRTSAGYYAGANPETTTSYTASTSQSGGRKSALYLAGAASITAICAAIYYLLPHDPAGGEIEVADRQPATDALDSVVGVTALDSSDVTTPASDTTTGLDDRAVVSGDLETTGDTGSAAVSLSPDDLFADAGATEDAVDTGTTAPAPTERDLTPPSTTLAAPDTPKPDIVAETSPELKVETVAPKPVAESSTAPAAPETVVAPSAKPSPPVISVASTAPVTTAPVEPRPQPQFVARAPMPSFTGEIRADSVASLLISQIEAGRDPLTQSERRSFAVDVQRALDVTAVGDSASVSTRDGRTVSLDITSANAPIRAVEFSRAIDMAATPENIEVAGGWFVTSSRANLRLTPELGSSDIRTVLPRNALVQQMGVFTDANGDTWRMIGQDGTAIGYLHSSVATPYAVAPTVPESPWRMAVPARTIDYVAADTPCKAFTASAGGLISGAGCLSASGQWLVAAPSTASASQTASINFARTSSTTSTVTSTPSSTQVVRSAASTNSPIVGRLGSMSRNVAEILFNPSAARRASRHGSQIPQSQVDSVFAQTGSYAVTGTGGRFGDVTIDAPTTSSHVQVVQRAADIPALPASMELDGSYAQTRAELRLMERPNGGVTAQPIQPRGAVLQVIGETTTDYGEAWSLVGRDGVGYGFVRTQALSNLQGEFAPTALTSGGNTVAQSVSVSSQCRTASYATPSGVSEMTACLGGDGHWQIVKREQPAYAVASMTLGG